MTNAKNNKKLGNATIRNQKQNERKKELRNVIKISKTISKLKNEKIKKKLSSKAKKATEKKKKLDHSVLKLIQYYDKLLKI